MKTLSLFAALFTLPLVSAPAALLITEVDPGGSGASYGADWFELTNSGAAVLDITGWKMDDSSNSFGSAAALSGITSLDPGESVIFFETASLSSVRANFITAWFGGNAPSGLRFGSYSGSGVGLSTNGDAVNIFNASGTLVANVTFGAVNGTATFDNATGTVTPSAAGVNGAFLSANGEIGSPGLTTTAVPESHEYAVAIAGLLTGVVLLRRRARTTA